MGFNGRTYTQACAHFSSALLSFVASPLQGHTSLSEVLLSPTAPPFFLKFSQCGFLSLLYKYWLTAVLYTYKSSFQKFSKEL